MAIKKELWQDQIIANLFKDNRLLSVVKREDQYVLMGAVVHIQQAGAKPAIVKNRTVLPAAISRRTDTDIVYLLDEYTSNPTLLVNAEQYEESPEKLQSVLAEHIATLSDTITDDMIVNWISAFAASGAGSPSSVIAHAQILRTTGTASSSYPVNGTTTSTRKLFLEDDLQKAKFTLNKKNVAMSGRYASVSSNMLDQLYNDLKAKYDLAYAKAVIDGEIPTLHGFTLLERSYVATFTNTGIVKAIGATEAATDNDGVLCFQQDALALALGSVKMFEELDKPEYYGDVYSALVRAGGRKRRANSEDVLVIVQDN